MVLVHNPVFGYITYNFLFLGKKTWVNIWALKANPILFEIISILKVNYHKSLLVDVNVGESWLLEAAMVLNCKVGRVTFVY